MAKQSTEMLQDSTATMEKQSRATLQQATTMLRKLLANDQVKHLLRMYGGHIVARVLCYWIPNFILYMVTRHGLCLKWKIQPKRHPKPQLVMETLLKNIFDDLFLQTVVTGAAYKLLSLGKKTPKDSASIEDKNDDEEQPASKTQGWACLRFTGPAPSALTHFWQVAVAYLGFDFMFYWSHRLMHHKSLYKHIHKIHHQYHTPIGIACAHEHPIESFIQLLAWWLPIGFAGFMNKNNGGLHVSTIFFHHCFRWLETVDSHSGYEIPFSPMHILPFLGSARRHDYHHREFDGNYGATLFWDWLCGTDKPFWQEVVENGGFMLGGGVTRR